MKRIPLLSIIVILLSSPVYADLISFDINQTADLPVYWDLEDLSKWYSHSIEVMDSDDATPVLGSTLNLKTNMDASGMMTGEGTAFLHWSIDAPVPVKIKLQSTGAMTTVDDNGRAIGSIHWTASWGGNDKDSATGAAEIEKDSVGGSASAYGTKDAIVHNGTLKEASSSGTCQIDFTTANAYDALSSTYSGTLTFVVEGI